MTRTLSAEAAERDQAWIDAGRELRRLVSEREALHRSRQIGELGSRVDEGNASNGYINYVARIA